MFTVSVDVLMRVHWSVKMIDINMELTSNIQIYSWHFSETKYQHLVTEAWVFCGVFYSLFKMCLNLGSLVVAGRRWSQNLDAQTVCDYRCRAGVHQGRWRRTFTCLRDTCQAKTDQFHTHKKQRNIKKKNTINKTLKAFPQSQNTLKHLHKVIRRNKRFQSHARNSIWLSSFHFLIIHFLCIYVDVLILSVIWLLKQCNFFNVIMNKALLCNISYFPP